MHKNYKSSNGITLVALVVTIVVLLILAGISLNMVLGEHGIIKKAKDAARQTDEVSLKEQVDLAIASVTMENDYQSNMGKVKLEIERIQGVEVTENSDGTLIVKKDGITANVDKDGNTTIVEQTGVDDGSGEGSISGTVEDAKDINAVISENKNTILQDTEQKTITIPAGYKIPSTSATKVRDGIVIEDESGNQWVWVPVDDPSIMFETGTYTLLGTSITTNLYSKSVILTI